MGSHVQDKNFVEDLDPLEKQLQRIELMPSEMGTIF
jgi:hypothetical protein